MRPPETLYGRWQQEARTLGYEPERLVREITTMVARAREQHLAETTGRDGADAPGRTPAGLPKRTIRTMFDPLAGPEGLTEQASTFTRREVLCAVGRELPADVAGMVGPAELEHLADRFLEDRAVSVMGDHAVGERRYATPELLKVERRLIDAAMNRTSEQASTCSHDTLRATLAAHPTIGADQAAMLRDITQGGQGVSMVVGKAGTGKTYALGVARHAWQLEGYRVLGAAPTGIATVCLDAEGFEHSRTVDALLGELDQEQHHGDSGHRDDRGHRQRDLTVNRPLLKGRVSMPQPATLTADRLMVGLVIRTGQVREPAGAWDEVAAFPGSGGDRCGFRLAAGVAPELEQVMGATQQLPLRVAGGQPTAQQPPRPADVLDLAEHRLDGLLPLGVAGLAVLASKFRLHRGAEAVALGRRRLAVPAGLALAGMLGRRDQKLRRIRDLGQVGDRPVAGVRQQRAGALLDAGSGQRRRRGLQHRVELLQVVGVLGELGRHDHLLAGGDRLGVVALHGALAGVQEAAVGGRWCWRLGADPLQGLGELRSWRV
jgi:hypothetical protein